MPLSATDRTEVLSLAPSCKISSQVDFEIEFLFRYAATLLNPPPNLSPALTLIDLVLTLCFASTREQPASPPPSRASPPHLHATLSLSSPSPRSTQVSEPS